MARKSTSPAVSQQRLDELEAALAELRHRQEAQPKSAVSGRMRLALLIQAFERRRDLVQAELDMHKE